jgi:hypothetical protein
MPDEFGKYTPNELRALKTDGVITIPVGSTCVDTLSYDTLTDVLVVSLNNGTDVAYMNYSFDEFVAFVNSDSKGSFYNHYVKGHYIKAY